MHEQIKALLKQYGINITEQRVIIMGAFLKSKDGLDYNHFLKHELYDIDRTTVFRTLNLFARKRIIYRIPATDGISRYLLQSETGGRSVVDHCSFICTKCRKVMPVDTVKPPRIKLPGGYKLSNMEIVMSGLCKLCK